VKKTRVFIVDDSIFFRKFLSDKLSAYPNIEVIGYAVNALDAKYAIPRAKPDVVTLDVEMPGMSGIDLLKHLMVTHPVPTVLVSAVNMSVFDALSAGAVDFVKKADSNVPGAADKFVQELVDTIEIAKTAHIRRPAPVQPAPVQPEPVQRPGFAQRPQFGQKPEFGQRPGTQPAAGQPQTPQRPAPVPSTPSGTILSTSIKSVVIALGASTGGTEATLVVLKQLPKHTPGMVIVQHMPPGFTKMYADRLNGLCQMEIREAKNGDRVERGVALIAPGDQQMQLVRSGALYTVRCYQGEKVSGHCPSVDVLFNSVAEAAGRDAVGIIMTGMGKDGADGLLNMKQKGAYTIGQDKESCVVYGMPMVAFNIGAVMKQAPCESIADVLKFHLNKL